MLMFASDAISFRYLTQRSRATTRLERRREPVDKLTAAASLHFSETKGSRASGLSKRCCDFE